MKIRIEFTGILNIKDLSNNSIIEIKEGLSVSDLLNKYKVSKEHQKFIIPIINKEEKSLSDKLKENDKLFLYLPVGGG